ncbi:helicase with zinc finger domain 2 isoform X1 [Anguilla anguilla]|uniref:helicase with zinc finger domain 2 isoform X1 n=1 Tax=Anguilla anguilla TaxID=7936 RepID=UPI0015A7FA75|nr:helicase with zinc finger domain 2 isoform X1 [Anguilla anguilla]
MMEQSIEHSLLCEILWTHELRVACNLCCRKQTEITYRPIFNDHQCSGDILLARQKGSTEIWKHISKRPEYPSPQTYAVCWHFVDGQGCTKHSHRCSFARSAEEAAVWNFQKRSNLELHQLKHLIGQMQFPNRRTQVRSLSAVEKIQLQFPGAFFELCKLCFHSHPPVASLRGLCRSGHPWSPLMVFYQELERGHVEWSEIRPLPSSRFSNYLYCLYVLREEPCQHGLERCNFAHNAVEMAVWTAERQEGLRRLELIWQPPNASQQVATSPPRQRLYCKPCKREFSSEDRFMNHCASLDHERMIQEDVVTEWKYRPPPVNVNLVLQLCTSPYTCVYGDNCIQAHSVEELQEWRMRDRTARRKAKAADEQGLLSYQERLLREYRNSLNEVLIMSEKVPGVTVSCDKDLTVLGRDLLPLKWTFKIQSETPLVEVALLKQDPGATFTLGEITPEDPCTYSKGQMFCCPDMSYDIPVSCKPLHPGLYEQWVVFDFDTRPVLLQKLEVRVGEQSSICPVRMKEDVRPPGQSLERWHQGNRVIVPCLNKREAEGNLLQQYKPPQINLLFNPRSEANIPITVHNYRERMHHFLYKEELAQEEVVSRLSLKVTISLFAKLTVGESEKKAPRGVLFAAVPVPYLLTPDTPEGFILKREVKSALVAPPSEAHQCQNVYEAIILPEVNKDRMYLQLSKSCCTKLNLKTNTTCEMEVQFQLNRQQFCEMHKAVDLLPDVEWVLPDLKKSSVPVHTGKYPSLNSKQQAAIAFIIGDPDSMKTVAPLLIYGPFGTGKTFTLATAVKELVQQPGTKVLICTHTNSSADLYVKDYFHQYVLSGCTRATPLRIKTQWTRVRATDRVTLKYCNLSPDKQSFEFPDMTTLSKFKIVITTTVTARLFHNINLPAGYFTHILIDEASQMLECEALMPLTLAGQGTRVVLAGDHMQMGPKLFSVDEDQRSNHTLLNRLFHRYQAEEDQSVASKSRIIFNENYRSTKDIVEFVSTHFYVGKSDAIKACGNVPPHPQYHPLRFYHIHGECHLDTSTMSWYNHEEVACVVDVVQKLIKEWPPQWGNQEQKMICVLSEGMQVFQIREELWKLRLGAVTVENSQNVQGKQFRAIVMSTIHTRESLKTYDIACLEFFNDPRVMNTVMTRAQSQVIVVGDAAALCSFGKCSRIWKSYIEQCIKTNSAEPQHLTEDFIESEVRETKRFTKKEDDEDDSSDTESSTPETSDIDDPILKELLDEGSDVRVTVTSEGLMSIFHTDNSSETTEFYSQKEEPHQDFSAPDLHQLLMTNPNDYKLCELVMKRYDSGYARPLDQPTLHITINGRKNVGHSFPGDQVVVEIDKQSSPPSGKVKGVLKRGGSSLFVCTIDQHDSQVMVPINNCVSKIYTPFWKDKPDHIAIRNIENDRLRPERFVKINEETKRNKLFVVKVLKWRERFRNPLGIAVDVLSQVTTLEGGLEVLDIEYQLRRALNSSIQEELKNYKGFTLNGKGRKDYRKYITFTIDPVNSEDMDDAISVRDLGQHYEVGVHIADIASFVKKDSPMDKYAQQQGTTFYRPEKEPAHMFPKDLSTEFFSLLPGCDRRAISLMVEVDKKTYRILRREFSLSVICSDRKMSYEDAEKIIKKKCKGSESCDSLEGCLVVAFNFSEVHRKNRMQEDSCYKSPDEDVHISEGRSHKMIEELMIMFNHAVSEHLITTEATKSLTPVRCQDEPDPEKMRQLKDKFSSLIPLSIHLSYQFNHLDGNQEFIRSASDQRAISMGKTVTEHRDYDVIPASDTFYVLKSLIEEIESAAQSKDIYKMAVLITTDDIHPQLLPVVTELRKLFQKANILRSNSVTHSKIGHCDLQLESYTWASSPIRRYIDIILQRLLHSVLENANIKYTVKEIDRFCVDFSQKYEKQTEYEKKAQSLRLASQLRQQSTGKVAFITDVASTGTSFNLSFPLNRTSMPHTLSIMYSHLQLTDQPEYDKESNCMTLKWMRRVYSFTNGKIRTELKKPQSDVLIAPVLRDTWKDILSALRMEKWKTVRESIQKIRSSITQDSQEQPNDSNREWQIVSRNTDSVAKTEPEHYVKLSLKLKVGEIIQVQLGTDSRRGLLVPVVQLVNVHPKFEICLEHIKNPTMCFSKYAVRASKKQYIDYMEYQKIWKPLCEMESASNAVAENDSIVLEDVKVTWKGKSKNTYLNGFFRLPLEKKKQWSIECDLLNCFLCFRLRDLKQTSTDTPEGTQPPSELVDTKSFTWVAHGMTTKVTDEETSKQLSYVQIHFSLNQLSMENIPDIGRNTNLTVELIPKLLPDARKETAIVNLTKANQLVKSIALGKTPRSRSGAAGYGLKRWNSELINQSLGLPCPNPSQRKAINEALDSPFTLIQGPPDIFLFFVNISNHNNWRSFPSGTGKTVVGVQVVFLFVMRNKQVLTSSKKTDNNGEKKKDGCILYCGPSNKSVDVVAEHLVKLREELKPLRVYSEQMEMLEFPYPGSHLKLSRKALREEKPNLELRSITLHHLIRAHGNPLAKQIQAFDARIQKGEELTDEEIESYKKLLNRARQLELVKHDVILCTCTAASNPNITKMLNLQQIIIDECAMATEPEAFIPLVSHNPNQIVLLGDHKQLQPIVHCDLGKRLGMRKSLFERYMEKAVMLDTQYRMHESICEFPSMEFYGGHLKTGVTRVPSVLLTKSRQPTPIVFGHLEGKEISLLVSTEKGNENSKANTEEAEQSVRVAWLLISHAQVAPSSIAILTPYNAQVAKINEILSERRIRDVSVSTIMKSQGSEWRYVILSTVRSRPVSEIDNEPTKAWLTRHLGFVMDPNQVNVGLTRAQEGLCIIGNKNLLRCSALWKRLLRHYQEKNCVMDCAKDIQVQKPGAKTFKRFSKSRS